MKIKVMKFGGTSVATPEARAVNARRVVDALEQGYNPVAVVSAIGRKGAPYATDTLIGELCGIHPQISPDARELDLMLACGEILSAVIFAQTIKGLGQRAIALTGTQAGIFTDGNYGNARIMGISPAGILKALDQGCIPVICGFQGVCQSDPLEINTLGRGGTDTTAAAVGAALKAECVEIYTDVDGIKSADPDYVPHAPTLRTMSYEEVAEMSHLGAKVLHPRAAEIAMRFNMPLWVKNSFTGDEGTEIVAEDVSYDHSVTGITHTGKLVYLQFDLSDVSVGHRSVLESRLYGVLAESGISLYMINLSPNGVGFAVSRDQYGDVDRLLDGLVIPLEGETKEMYVFQLGQASSREVNAQARMLESVGPVHRVVAERTEDCTMVSVIGRKYFGQPGVFYTILSGLLEAKIHVLQTSDSDFSVSCLIPEADTHRAVKMLHDRFVPAIA